MDRRRLKLSVRLVLSRLRRRDDAASAEGMRVPYEVLAERWGISVPTISRALRVLRAMGVIGLDTSVRPPVIRYYRRDIRSARSDATVDH